MGSDERKLTENVERELRAELSKHRSIIEEESGCWRGFCACSDACSYTDFNDVEEWVLYHTVEVVTHVAIRLLDEATVAATERCAAFIREQAKRYIGQGAKKCIINEIATLMETELLTAPQRDALEAERVGAILTEIISLREWWNGVEHGSTLDYCSRRIADLERRLAELTGAGKEKGNG